MKKVLIILAVAVILLIGVGIYIIEEPRTIAKACTEEAKICPDGSAVGRTGPKCEFAPCPETTKPDNATSAKLNQTIVINTISITPLAVSQDSRCAVDVTCIWAGTVVLHARLSYGNEKLETDLTLGSPLQFSNHLVTLTEVTPARHSQQTITLIDYQFSFKVSSVVTIVTSGTLAGRMTIGPICPVEQLDHPCQPTPEMFAARKIYVYLPDKTTQVKIITPSGDGTFSASLPAGIYYVTMPSQGIGSVTGLPATVTIKPSQTVAIVVDVDTGLR